MVFLITDDAIRCKMKKETYPKRFSERRDFTPSPIVVFERMTTPVSLYYYQDETLELELEVKVKKKTVSGHRQYGSVNISGQSKYCLKKWVPRSLLLSSPPNVA